MAVKKSVSTRKSPARRVKRTRVSTAADRPMAVRARGKALGRDLRAGKRARRMRASVKAKLLATVAPRLITKGLWDYAYLTARRPWIDNVARLAVVHASMRSNPNDFLLSSSDGKYHTPFAGVYFRAPKADVPILIDFLVNALVSQTVHISAGGKVQATALSAGFHHVSIILVPHTANLHHATLRTQKGDPKRSLLEIDAVELTTLN